MEKKDFYEGEYMPQMHKIGKLTGLLGAVLSFLPALVLAVVYGLLPKPAALATAFISAASAFGFLWVVEPISYFTVLGPVGTYICEFLVPVWLRSQLTLNQEQKKVRSFQ